MAPASDCLRLDRLSSPELQDLCITSRLGGGKLIACLPIGSVEQHGPLLPLGTDTRIAEELASGLLTSQAFRQNNWHGLLLPSYAYTNADTGLEFQGTLSVEHNALRGAFASILASILRLDIDALLLVNGHGPNDPWLGELAFRANQEQFRSQHQIKPVIMASVPQVMIKAYEGFSYPKGRHADWMELALAYALLGPELLADREEAFAQQAAVDAPASFPIVGIPLKSRSSSGILGLGWPKDRDIAELSGQVRDAVVPALQQAVTAAIQQALGYRDEQRDDLPA
ncbi:MAG: creatininase family protein [Alphaproteobacteria bacterium]|nr:creatininase family protein [Alphaproteobacteria bacterium]